MKSLSAYGAAAALAGALALGEISAAAFARFDATLQPPSTTVAVQGFDTDAQIYLVRGLANVFSLGMDDLADKLRPFGYKPVVDNWRAAQGAANTIAGNYGRRQTSPIILVGHSLGAGAVFDIAENLRKRNVPVAYMVTYDLPAERTVPGNVKEYINFYQRNGFGHKASPPPGYKGTMINVDVTDRKDLKHGNMDENTRAHEIIMGKIFQITARR
jgi:hypothetical protein